MYLCMYFSSFSSTNLISNVSPPCVSHPTMSAPHEPRVLCFGDCSISSLRLLRNCFIHCLASAAAFSLLGDFLTTFSDFTASLSLRDFSFFGDCCSISNRLLRYSFLHSSMSFLICASMALWTDIGIFGIGMLSLRTSLPVNVLIPWLIGRAAHSPGPYWWQKTARDSWGQIRLHVSMWACMHACRYVLK